MDIVDVQKCADYFYDNYLRTFYLVTTYNNKSFILVGEKANFPHLMGIQQNTYKSNGYARPAHLFNDIANRKNIVNSIVPRNISTTSKMYKKVFNFKDSSSIFWNNNCPVIINYNPSYNQSRLGNVDIIITDMSKGYMLGWVSNRRVPVNGNVSIEKYCICTWIDENNGSQASKEKYMPQQDVELPRYVFSFDENSNFQKKKEYKYTSLQKRAFLEIFARNNCNLLIDSNNISYYARIAQANNIHCRINGIMY